MKSFFMALSLAPLAFMACNSDTQKKNQLNGRWTLKYGEWNGQPAPMLEHVHFVFNNDSIQTNFTLSEQEESATFEIKEMKIFQKTTQPINYQIDSLTDSTLEMSTALRGAEFKLFLIKE
jgi:hypothetical protein